MGRKDYADDLATAQYLELPHIHSIRSLEDGEFTFTFRSASGLAGDITAILPDVSEYPKSHEYMLFASDNAPAVITTALDSMPSTRRKTIPQLLDILSRHLKSATSTGGQHDPLELDDDGDVQLNDIGDGDVVEVDSDNDGDNEDWGQDDDFVAINSPSSDQAQDSSSSTKGQFPSRVRNDLLTAKAAGFKVGAHGQLSHGNSCYVSLSCRIEKLGISEEAMQAWSLEPSQYLCLVLHFPGGYKDLDALMSRSAQITRKEVVMRVGISDFYKPRTLHDAKTFFQPDHNKFHNTEIAPTDARQIRDTFISDPINTLLNERLLIMISFRLGEAMSWWGAERHYNDTQGMHTSNRSKRSKRDYGTEDPPRSSYPQIVMEDELASMKAESQLSFPLIAMQFLLRHFVRCTEFCLVCHTRLNSDVEAIKPYVCDNPLCLYQYMSLGFGPSVEHEILAQPLVVDVLISFCYTSVLAKRVRELPQGLSWSVPHPQALLAGRRDTITSGNRTFLGYYYGQPEQDTPSNLKPVEFYSARLNRSEMQLLFDKECASLSIGSWVAINVKDQDPVCWHCRVTKIMFPTVTLSKTPIVQASRNKNGIAKKENAKPSTSASTWEPVDLYIYDTNFDDLSNPEKQSTMVLLMDLMPSVREMREHLLEIPGSTIPKWHGRMTDASIGLLRWIVASNRSCIMQVDEEDPLQSTDLEMSMDVKKGEHRISGIDGWLQFRFAMGAPDKEQRFLDSLSNATSPYSSLFAWHGSPLSNWHSIIREGLNFKETLHGRAYGNGCYHASDWNTSMSYSGAMGVYSGTEQYQLGWPSSVLKVSNAIALSEIVNAPKQYTSSHPFYVVQHVDWIQTRYLFVQPSEKVKVAADADIDPNELLPQDPQRTPQGPHGTLQIPASAVPKSRRPVRGGVNKKSHSSTGSTRKDMKAHQMLTVDNLASLSKGKGTQASPITLDAASVDTLDEDRVLLSEPPSAARPPTPPPSMPHTPLTPYAPGTIANLPTMPAPTYATPKASMTIQKAFREVQRTQDKHIKDGNLWELGWYVDVEHFEASDNLYQWIIQMHSFPLNIPLGKDMQDTKVDAITFEIRFSANYPFAPPFLRVIRPRFLPFQLGGGGHVTAGGSVCMDLLTSSGWTAAYSIESILLQVRMALMSTDPRPARLERAASSSHMSYHAYSTPAGRDEYGEAEAVDAFERACRTHGWEIPREIRAMMGHGYRS